MRAAITNAGAASGAGTAFNWPEAIGYSRQPFASLTAGPGKITAGPDGLVLARFCWVDPNAGLAYNVRTAGFFLGFALPCFNLYNWQRAYPCKGSIVLRAEMECTIAAAGVMRTRFPLGAQAGSRVWTDPATGIAYSSNVTGEYIETAYAVMQNGGCNAHCRISSFVSPFN